VSQPGVSRLAYRAIHNATRGLSSRNSKMSLPFSSQTADVNVCATRFLSLPKWADNFINTTTKEARRDIYLSPGQWPISTNLTWFLVVARRATQ